MDVAGLHWIFVKTQQDSAGIHQPWLLNAQQSPVSRRPVVAGICHDSGSHRIEVHVCEEVLEVLLLGHQPCPVR
jgi:hypothetical protein